MRSSFVRCPGRRRGLRGHHNDRDARELEYVLGLASEKGSTEAAVASAADKDELRRPPLRFFEYQLVGCGTVADTEHGLDVDADARAIAADVLQRVLEPALSTFTGGSLVRLAEIQKMFRRFILEYRDRPDVTWVRDGQIDGERGRSKRHRRAVDGHENLVSR